MIEFVGYFRELQHGRLDGPSIHDAVRFEAASHEAELVNYLERGAVLATTGRLVDDLLDPTEQSVAPLDTRTDGTWIWPGDLAYYVGRYHVEVPIKFIEEAAPRGWTPPKLSLHELSEIANEVWARDETMTIPDAAFIRASLELLPTARGGRKRPIHTGYRPNCMLVGHEQNLEEGYLDAVVHLEHGDSLEPGDVGTVRLQPALPDGWSAITIGTKIDLCEGDRVVGTAVVSEVWPQR